MHLLAASHSHGCWAISGIYWVATAPSSANWARLHQLCNNVLICPVQQLSSCSTVNWDVSASGRGKNKNLQSHCLWVTAQAHSYARLEVKSLQARVILSPYLQDALFASLSPRMYLLPGVTLQQAQHALPFIGSSTGINIYKLSQPWTPKVSFHDRTGNQSLLQFGSQPAVAWWLFHQTDLKSAFNPAGRAAKSRDPGQSRKDAHAVRAVGDISVLITTSCFAYQLCA